MDITAAQIARFHSYVDRSSGPLACWPWTRSSIENGYGNFWIGEDTAHGKVVLATHVALTLDGRPRPEWKPKALHTCHYPPCCNPLHLYWGTQADNMRDALEAGRFPNRAGAANSQSKLTEEKVYDIRGMYDANLSPNYIAKHHKVTRNTVWRIGTRKAWGHLPERP
jgi:hypothetical protein